MRRRGSRSSGSGGPVRTNFLIVQLAVSSIRQRRSASLTAGNDRFQPLPGPRQHTRPSPMPCVKKPPECDTTGRFRVRSPRRPGSCDRAWSRCLRSQMLHLGWIPPQLVFLIGLVVFLAGLAYLDESRTRCLRQWQASCGNWARSMFSLLTAGS